MLNPDSKSPEAIARDTEEQERVRLIEGRKRDAEQRFYRRKINRAELDQIRTNLELEKLNF